MGMDEEGIRCRYRAHRGTDQAEQGTTPGEGKETQDEVWV